MEDCTARDDNQYITSMRCRGCHVRVILGHTLPHGGRIYYLCVEYMGQKYRHNLAVVTSESIAYHELAT